MATIKAIYRYPVKGLSGEKLKFADVEAGRGLPLDRYWALEHGQFQFDPENPQYIKKGRFAQLLSSPKLAQLDCRIAGPHHTMTIKLRGKTVFEQNLDIEVGRSALEAFIEEFADAELSGPLRLVSTSGHHFSDIPEPAMSIINLASVEDLAKRIGQPIDPLRFRGNLYLEGLEPWVELKWTGRSLFTSGHAALEVFAPIGRCQATHVNTETGEKDMEIVSHLRDNYDHTLCGVYATMIDTGTIKTGDTISIGRLAG